MWCKDGLLGKQHGNLLRAELSYRYVRFVISSRNHRYFLLLEYLNIQLSIYISEINQENKHIAIKLDDHYFICANNGILSMICNDITPDQIVEVNIHDKIPKMYKTVPVNGGVVSRL